MSLVSLSAACLLGSLLTAGPAAPAPPVAALAFSPDGSALAAAQGRNVLIRSPGDAAVVRSIPSGLKRVMALCFHPRGHMLAAAGGSPGESGEAVLLDWRRGEETARLGGHKDLATGVAFNGDGSLVVLSSADGGASVHRLPEGRPAEEAFRLAGHAGAVLAAGFSLDGRLIVTAGADRSVKVWSADDGALLRSLNHHGEAVNALAIRPAEGGEPAEDGQAARVHCATGSDDRTVRVWEPGTGRMVRIVRKHQGPVLALKYSIDGRSLFTAGEEGIIRRVDAGSDEVRKEWKAHQDWIYSLAVSPDGKTLASGDWSGVVKLWPVGEIGEAPPARTRNSLGMVLVRLSPGEFLMGSPEAEARAMLEKVEDPWYRRSPLSESPERRVRISSAFYLGAHEVTVAQFRAFADAAGYRTDAERDGRGADGKVDGRWTTAPGFNWRTMGHERGDDEPVVNVTWNDAVAFCEWLSMKEGLAYRLPTEAEWEYACRAGSTTRFFWGDEESGRDEHVWSAASSRGGPSPVGRLRPNGWGLHDMLGNVYEYCSDRFSSHPPAAGPLVDPKGPLEGEEIVVRGASWGTDPLHCRCAFRGGAGKIHRNRRDGFRVAREEGP